MQCGVLEVQCGVLEVQCGVLEGQCGVLEVQCGVLEVQCGVLEVQCGVLVLCCLNWKSEIRAHRNNEFQAIRFIPGETTFARKAKACNQFLQCARRQSCY